MISNSVEQSDRTKLKDENAVLDEKICIAKKKLDQRKKELGKLVTKKEAAKAELARTRISYVDKITKTMQVKKKNVFFM